MALKATVSKAEFDALPEAVRAEYTEKNGSYALTVEGFVPKTELDLANTRLTEFRDNNRTLNEKAATVDALAAKLAKFDGIEDPDAAKALLAEVKAKGGKGTKDDIGEMIKASVEAAVNPLKQALASETTARQQAQAAADKATFRELLGAEAKKMGVKDSALKHVLREGEEVFTSKDGALVAKDGKFSKDRPTEPLPATEWLAEVKKTDGYLFEESSGGGANPQNGSGNRTTAARTLNNPDAMTIGQNLEDIASGKAVVAQ